MTLDTCRKSEYLEIQKEIYDLSLDVLNNEEIEQAEEISNNLVSTKARKEKARMALRKKIGVKPSRPLFYANLELKSLPRYTRSGIRYVGDYLDHLVKFWASEINGKTFLTKSLGINLKNMRNKIDEILRLNLIKYNNLCYVPAKHDFNVKNRKRRFTSKEAVYIVFMTMKLAKIIISKSKKASQYSNSEIDDDWATMKYNAENKDILVED